MHRRLIGSMILALLVLVITAASGNAATRRFTDPNDARGIDGTCLGNAKHARVSVQFVRRNGTDADWAPAFRRFYPWVSRY